MEQPINFYRTLSFLEANLSHPNCGDILCSLLERFENIELEQLAEQWLNNFGLTYIKQSEEAVALVTTLTAHVLTAHYSHSEIITKLALELCRTNQDLDLTLVLAMLEHISDDAVETIALKLLQSKRPGGYIVAGALLKRNSQFENEIREVILKSESVERDFLLRDVGSKSLPGRYIVMDYLQGCSDRELVEGTLPDILCSDPSTEIVSFAWQKFSENLNSTNSFELLEAILSCKEFSVPEEAISNAFEKCKIELENEFWARLLCAAIRAKPTKEMLNYALQNIHNCQISPDEARIMLAINDKAESMQFDDAVIDWMRATLLKIPQDRFAASWLLEVVDAVRTKRPERSSELNDILENLLPRTNSDIGSIYARLIEHGKLHLIPQASSWLFARRLDWRWGHLHFEKGELIEALLPHAPADERLLTLTQSWLERGKNLYCAELYERVRKAYEMAKL